MLEASCIQTGKKMEIFSREDNSPRSMSKSSSDRVLQSRSGSFYNSPVQPRGLYSKDCIMHKRTSLIPIPLPYQHRNCTLSMTFTRLSTILVLTFILFGFVSSPLLPPQRLRSALHFHPIQPALFLPECLLFSFMAAG